jgi:hypothetical protein
MKHTAIYQSHHFQPFCVEELWPEKKPIVFLHNNTGILLKQHMKNELLIRDINKKLQFSCHIHPDDFDILNIFTQQKIVFIQLKKDFHSVAECKQIDIEHFYHALIQQEIHIVKQFYKTVWQHLKNREVDNKKLVQFDNIKIALGEISAKIELLNQTSMTGYFTQLIDEIFEKLIKLAGGRSFLGGNLFEAAYFIRLINTIYLRDAYEA